jgi:hypothetical protein
MRECSVQQGKKFLGHNLAGQGGAFCQNALTVKQQRALRKEQVSILNAA